jgi:hypothetical protein
LLKSNIHAIKQLPRAPGSRLFGAELPVYGNGDRRARQIAPKTGQAARFMASEAVARMWYEYCKIPERSRIDRIRVAASAPQPVVSWKLKRSAAELTRVDDDGSSDE